MKSPCEHPLPVILVQPMSRLAIKVVPSSSRDVVAGWLGESLKVKVRAPAERGRANVAARKLVATALDLPPERLKLVRGHASARKVLEVSGLSSSEIRRRLEALEG